MQIKIKEVSSRRDLINFIKFPIRLYDGSPYYVPALIFDEINTLDPKRNAAFQNCRAKYWLAYGDGKIVGRVAAILNTKHIEKWKQAYVRFGWLDFIDDAAVSAALLGAVEAYAKENGSQAVHGPLGFTDLDREGMLIEGFDEMGTLATNYNYPYYPEHMARLGYQKDVDWVEYEIKPPTDPNEKISTLAKTVLKRSELSLLITRNRKQLMAYSQQIFQLINEEYAHLYGTIVLSEKQITQYIQQYFNFVDTELVPLVLDKHDKVIAFGIAMPSLSEALIKCRGRLLPLGWMHLLRALHVNDRADLYLVAISKAYQGKGVNAVLMDAMVKAFIKRGIRLVESNPELENNLQVQTQWKSFDQRLHKRRRCYIKEL